MINANYIAINEYNLFNDVCNEKQVPRNVTLKIIQGRINNYYTTYLTTFNNLQYQRRSNILRAENAEKAALIHCFDSPTNSFKPIRGRIKAGQNNLLKIICPYCLLNEWDTLDHYIPKASFPEYSILVKNLIPCCSQCNKLKDETWRSGLQRRFVHFYNDTFLNNRFLFARIIVKRATGLPTIKFYLQKPMAITQYQFSVVKFHFKELKLIERYSELTNAVISSYIDIISSHVANGIDNLGDLQTTLNDSYTAKSLSYSINYYEAVVYEAFALNTRFLNSLIP